MLGIADLAETIRMMQDFIGISFMVTRAATKKASKIPWKSRWEDYLVTWVYTEEKVEKKQT